MKVFKVIFVWYLLLANKQFIVYVDVCAYVCLHAGSEPKAFSMLRIHSTTEINL